MSFEGMDVDQLTALAKQIDSAAQALYNLVTSLTGTMGGLTLLWHGPVAATFEQDWESKNRPALLAAYNTLTNLHTHLVNNINQQTSASAADGGILSRVDGGILSTIAGDAHDLWGDWEKIANPAALIHFLPDEVHELSGKEYNPRAKAYKEYNKAWDKLTQLDHDSKFLKYHESPVLRYVHDASYVKNADKILVRTHIAPFLGPVGAVLALPDAIVNTGEAIVDLKDHRYNSAIQHAGTVAEDEGGPVGLLGGFATRLIAQDYELGKQLQWSDTPNPFSGDNFKQDWLPSIEEAPKKTFDTVWNAFFG